MAAWKLGKTIIILSSFYILAADAIRCYTCDSGDDNLCTVGLLGKKVECPAETKSCYKSWTVETSPLTKRKCGDERAYANGCKDVLFGQNSMLACYCNEEDYCNSAQFGTSSPLNVALCLSFALVYKYQLSSSSSSSS